MTSIVVSHGVRKLKINTCCLVSSQIYLEKVGVLIIVSSRFHISPKYSDILKAPYSSKIDILFSKKGLIN